MAADYCTAQDVKDYLQMTGAAYDTLLVKMVTAASRLIDDYCQHPLSFDQETVTETVRAQVDKDGGLRVAVGKPVVISVSSFGWTYSPSISPVVIPTSQLWIEGYMVLAPDAGLGAYRNKPIRVAMTYIGGYSPMLGDIVHAARVLAARFFKQKDAGWSDVVGVEQFGTLVYNKVMPREVREMLDHCKRVAPI
jgi:hypothetical protein